MNLHIKECDTNALDAKADPSLAFLWPTLAANKRNETQVHQGKMTREK